MAERLNGRLVNEFLQINFHCPIQQSVRPPMIHQMTSPRRIREDLHHVLRGLTPLMERPSNLGSVMPQNISTWIRQHQTIPSDFPRQQQNSLLIAGASPLQQQIRDISIQIDESREENASSSEQPRGTENIRNDGDTDRLNQNSGNRNEPSANGDAVDTLRNNPELHSFLCAVEKYVPFALILLLKVVFDHRIGLIVVAGLLIAFCHANSIVKREVGKQSKRHVGSLLIAALNIATCIIFVYFVLAENYLAYALVFIPPYGEPLTVWTVLWIVTVTDFVLKLLTVALKALIVALPADVIAFQNKGKYYFFLETVSQLYRSLTPIRHWLYYFTSAYNGASHIFGIFLSVSYFIFKCQELIKRIRECQRGIQRLFQSVTYGSRPTSEQLKDAGGICPICQDDFKVPTLLQCKHIFCEECVSVWFDREKTCPMCRAEIADDPKWRDGATSLLIQIF